MRLRQLHGEKERQAWQSKGKVTPRRDERWPDGRRKTLSLKDLGYAVALPNAVLAPRRRRRRQFAEPIRRPRGDRVGKPVHEPFVDLEAERRLGKLVGITYENAALPKQPQRADDRLLVRGPARQESTSQRGRDREERRRLPGHEFAKDRTRPERFPVEDAHIFAELVARGHWAQLPAHKSPQCRFAWEVVLRPVVILHQRVQCRLQNRAIKPFLAAEVIIDRGLVDVRLGDDGSDAGTLLPITCKRIGRRFDDLVPRGLRDSGHFCWPRHADSEN